ncbi:hypothetical protein [Heyndrickxia sporothermodurans]|uniref:hypothetical protein n=2 Tax=Heyndrickxia sporothermodurans TaxID=46224 RepID=UPI003692126A
MCAAKWSMDFPDVDRLVESISKIPNRSETVINKTLRAKGAPKAMDSIQPIIPLSRKKKKHARDSKALVVKHGNLEFTIRPKRAFEYIKYPDLGIGTSKKKQPKEFMKKGLDKAASRIVDDLADAVIKEIDNTLGE